MTTWLFRDALEELKSRGRFDESVLQSALGLHLGDIRFAEIQTTIKMHVVPICTFLQFIKQGCFNADNLPLDGYSHTMAILLAFIPDTCLMDIEHVGIGSMIQRCGSPLGDISSIPVVMDSIRRVLDSEHKKSPPKCRAYMMLIGNYGGHMAFATDPPYCVSLASHVSYFCTHGLSIIRFINIQMTTWLFRDALEELESRGRFNESVLQSVLGLRLGDIRFAEIQTTIKMHVVPICTFLQFIKLGRFNADNLPLEGYSHTMAILLAFIPDTCLMDMEHMGISSMIQRCGSPLGDISSIPVVMDSIRRVLDSEHKKSPLKCRAYMMLIGNYGGHIAFATDPPYCVAYAADYKNTNDPSKMMPCEPLNHAYAMVTGNMVVRRLLSVPNWEPAERKLTVGGHLLILRGMHFDSGLFLDLVILHNCAGPLVNSVTWHRSDFSQHSRGSGIVYS